MNIATITSTFQASAPSESIQAAGFFDWANNILSSAQALLGTLLIVLGLLVFIIVAWRTKTIPGIIGGLVSGAIIGGAGAIIVALSGVFSQTIQEGNQQAVPEISYIQQHQMSELA